MSTLIEFAVAIVGIVGALAVMFFGGKRIGRSEERLDQAEKRNRLQEHYDEIERENVDPGGAYDRLRGMSDEPRRR